MFSTSIRIALAAVFAVISFAASATEQAVNFMVNGMKVVGTLNLPDGVKKPPVVLLLHSFGGSQDEMKIPAVNEGIFARTARVWAKQGIASLRIDYRFTVTDPETWSKPWSAAIAWSKTGTLYEYACNEDNYGMYGILSGSRAQENAAHK